MFYRKKDYRQHHWEVTWKKSRKFQQDVFNWLKDFCIFYPSYNEQALLDYMKSRRRYHFENDDLVIKRIPYQYKGIQGERPNLRDSFFWELDIPALEWNRSYTFVIERVLARGNSADFNELVRFYGLDTVINTFRNQARFWPEHMEEDARLYFKLEPEDLFMHHHRLLSDDWNVWTKNYLGQDNVKKA